MIPAWDKSIDLLARAELSSYDLIRKLKSRGYEQEEIEDTVTRLYEAGYLNDERYARAYIRRYSSDRSSGRILQELRQKGIQPEDPQQLLQEVYEEEERSENQVLQKLIHSRLRYVPESVMLDMKNTKARTDKKDMNGNVNGNVNGNKELNRLYSFLLRRGFSYGAVREAVDRYITENA